MDALRNGGRHVIAYLIDKPDCVLVLGGEVGVQRLRRSEYTRDWCGSTKRMLRARRKGLLVDVAEVRFERAERRWRVERDEIGRDVLVVGPRVCLLHCCRDESSRPMDGQLVDLFGDRHWMADEAAHAAAALAERQGYGIERIAV